MTRYIADWLSIPEKHAHDLREHYWRRYGATLKGLVRHHGVDERHFLWHTHQFPDLASMLRREQGLRSSLGRLPGRKVILTNAPLHYAQTVLSLLRIDGYFSAVYAIESVGYRPKPDPHGFLTVLRTQRVRAARQAIVVDDTLANLRAAKTLGMRTIWISPQAKRPDYVDFTAKNVARICNSYSRQGILR